MSYDNHNSYIIFSLSGHEFAVKLTESKQVVPFTNITPVPFTDKFVAGIYNFHNQLIAVFRLDVILALNNLDSPKTKILLLKNENELFGVMIDRVEAISSILEEEITHLDGNYGLEKTDFMRGVYRRKNDSKPVIVISVSSLIQSDIFNRYSLK